MGASAKLQVGREAAGRDRYNIEKDSAPKG